MKQKRHTPEQLKGVRTRAKGYYFIFFLLVLCKRLIQPVLEGNGAHKKVKGVHG